MNELKSEIRDTLSSSATSLNSSQTAGKDVSVKANKAEKALPGGKELPGGRPEIAELSEDQVSDAVSKINQYVQNMERTLEFQVDEDSGRTVIKVFDRESEELIRQIPGELALKLAQKLNDDEPSLLFSAKV